MTEERHYWPGDDDPTAMLLRQGGGFGRMIALDTGLAALVGASDGELSVGAIVAALGELLDVDGRRSPPTSFRPCAHSSTTGCCGCPSSDPRAERRAAAEAGGAAAETAPAMAPI